MYKRKTVGSDASKTCDEEKGTQFKEMDSMKKAGRDAKKCYVAKKGAC